MKKLITLALTFLLNKIKGKSLPNGNTYYWGIGTYFIIALLAVIMAGCVKTKENGEPIVSNYYKQHSVDNPYLQVLDSCEYICWNGRMAHKGNCKFCEERDSIKWEKRKAKLRELVEQLKEK